MMAVIGVARLAGAGGKDDDRKLAMIWFFIQLVLGVLWSVAFFWLHSPALGLGVIMVFLIAIVITIVLFDRMSRSRRCC